MSSYNLIWILIQMLLKDKTDELNEKDKKE